MDPIMTTLAKTAEAGLAEASKENSQSFLKAVLHEPAQELGALLGDKIRERRHANLIKTTSRAQERLKEAGLTAKEVPLSIIHPALESASVEEDPDLQEIWANMLANAANPESPDAVAPSFPAILKELRPVDVKFLATLHEEFVVKYFETDPDPRSSRSPLIGYKSLRYVMEKAGLMEHERIGRQTDRTLHFAAIARDNNELAFILDSLQRHRIIEQEYGVAKETGAEGSVEIGSAWRISQLGVRFTQACRPPKETKSPEARRQ
jgi:Abortive infection alpha